MAKPRSVRLDKRQREALAKLSENGEADDASDALRKALDEGLAELGYFNGRRRDTALRRNTRRAANTLAMVALAMLGVAWVAPVDILRLAVVVPLVMAVTCYGIERYLRANEPAVSQALAGLVGAGDD